MARIRSIKPEFWKSEAIACYDYFTRLVFIGLWTYVDDNGVGLDNPRLVTAELFPLEDDLHDTLARVHRALDALAAGGRVVRYTVRGKAYLAIVNWDEHQKIDRPAKPRYPEPDDGDATPTPPPTSPDDPSPRSSDEPSRDTRETVASPHRLDQGSGNRGSGNRDQGTRALASLDASDVIDAEIVDPPPTAGLFVVPDPPGTDLATTEPVNAGHITRQWVDYCAGRNVKLTTTAIKRYGRHVKDALGQGFTVELVKRALAEMLADNVASRPALFDTYLIRVQQGPEKPPRRQTRGEAAAARHAPDGANVGALIHDALTRPA